jgi:hypothetical protein
MYPPKIRPYRTLKAHFSEKTLRQMAEYVIRNKGKTSPFIKKRLESGLSDLVVPGSFRDPSKAPPGLQAMAIMGSFYAAHAWTVLSAWMDLQLDLRLKVREFLAKREVSIHQPDELPPGFLSKWHESELKALAGEFAETNPGFEAEEIELMLCCLTGRAPVTDDEESEDEGIDEGEPEFPADDKTTDETTKELKASAIVVECLQALIDEDVTSDLSDWEELRSHMASLVSFIDTKIERQKATAALRQAVSRLIEVCGKHLSAYFNLNCEHWSTANCAPERVATLRAQIDEFGALVKDHDTLYRNPGRNRAEEQTRRNRLASLEKSIDEGYKRISDAIEPAPVAPPDLPPSETSTEKTAQEPMIEKEEAHGEQASSPAAEELISPAEEEPQKKDKGEESAPTEESPARAFVTVEPPVVQKVEEFPHPPEKASAAKQEPPPPGQQEQLPQPVTATAKDAAIALEKEDQDEAWARLAWLLLAEGDTSGAYWIARWMDLMGRTVPVPYWLLAALQGAEWVSDDSDALVFDLLEITTNHTLSDGKPVELLATAASLYPTLVAPSSGLGSWLKTPGTWPALRELVEAIRDFSRFGQAINAEDLLHIEGREIQESSVKAVSLEARRFLGSAEVKRTKLRRANEVWTRLVRRHLSDLLTPISENQREKLSDVRKRLETWETRNHVIQFIDAADEELVGRRLRPIVGDPRDQIVRWVTEACSIARRWCQAVQQEAFRQDKGGWFIQQVTQLRKRVKDILPEADSCLKAASVSDCCWLSACARVLERSIGKTAAFLRISEASGARVVKQPPITASESLSVGLTRRLLYLPGLQLDDNGDPVEASLARIGPAFQKRVAEPKILNQVIQE